MELHTLDLNFAETPEAMAAYLVIGDGGPALVETGPHSTLETLKARLGDFGYTIADVRHVFVTHIHLDHSGAAGWLARTGAQVFVHPAGARHLIDPSRLLASAARIYGDAMESLWGETVPVPAKQVHALADGESVQIGELTFVALDAPGHANHHNVYRLGDVAFTGDVAGVRRPGSPFISVPAPPPEFDLEAWHRTIERLLAEQLAAIYPTHYGPVYTVREHLEELAELIDESAEFIRLKMSAGLERDAVLEAYLAWVNRRAYSQGLSDHDIQMLEPSNPSQMSVDGLMRYWRKKAEG
jgi:glyoxylase-like metal-dependent hydrolase (beta-lactamase superfamily II)